MSGRGLPQNSLSFIATGPGPAALIGAPQDLSPLRQQGSGRASASSTVAKDLENKVIGEHVGVGTRHFLPHQGFDS